MRTWLAIGSLGVLALSGCVQQGASSSSAMQEKRAMKEKRGGPGMQGSFTCQTCGGTYAQDGNCPKCGLELVPKEGTSPSAEKPY